MPIAATSRIQRRYDHRLKALVRSAGSIDIALEHGIPRSTAQGWLRHGGSPSVISTDVVDLKYVVGVSACLQADKMA